MANTQKTQAEQVIETTKEELERYEQDFNEHKADFMERFEANPMDTLGWRASGMVKVQVKMGLAKQTLDMIEAACGDDPKDMERFFGESEPPAREIERVLIALRTARQRFTDSLLRRELFNYSTSPDGDLVEMTKARATADFLQSHNRGSLSFLIGHIEFFLKKEAKEAAEAKAA